MWKYIRKYLPFAIAAILFMAMEVYVDLIQPQLMRSIVDDGVLGVNAGGTGDLQIILSNGIKMILFVLLGCVCGSMNAVCVNLTTQNMGNLMRKDLFSRIMSFSSLQTDKFSTGSLITRVTNDVTQTEGMVAQVIRGLVRMGLTIVGSLIFLLQINRSYSLMVLAVLPFMILFTVLVLRKVTPKFLKVQQQLDNLNNIMQEDITGFRLIKACVKETYEKLRFGKASKEMIGTQLSVLILLAWMSPVMSILMNTTVAGILYLGNIEVHAGASSPGGVMAAITYTTQLLSGVLMLLMLFQMIARGMTSWRRVKEVLSTDPAMPDGNGVGEAPVPGEVEFRDVSYAFSIFGKPVLRDISLKIEKGQTLAIMGMTGCGKSTLVNLLIRFYEASAGEVLVGGRNVKDYTFQELRDRVSFVLQKSELFGKSVADNIRMDCDWATEEDIAKAARIAQADSFIEELPEKYDTVLAQRGMSLSGGQKQRLAIARAVLKKSDVLVFDDATSALDLKTEADLFEALNRERPDMTKVIVAQRIATVKRADRIVVLSDGKISGIGKHEELLATNAIYKDIYESQMGKEKDS
ncbi:MAG: ABC transporter ATP-binding protein [Bacteroidales bacterium]|nr:ABC transporter ATP-binding protein [Bacteroidales bacterium]